MQPFFFHWSCTHLSYWRLSYNKTQCVEGLYCQNNVRVCHDVPQLQPLTGESFTHSTANTADTVCLDISALRFWDNRYQRAFFDVRVFNPIALCNRKLQIPSAHQGQGREKKGQYKQMVDEIELASFTPLVFSASGWMAKSTSVAYKRLASLLAEKRDQPYNLVLAWLCCKHSFSRLRSAITCIRESRSLYKKNYTYLLDLGVNEGQIPHTQWH